MIILLWAHEALIFELRYGWPLMIAIGGAIGIAEIRAFNRAARRR